MLQSLIDVFVNNWPMILENTGISIYIVVISTLFSYLFGVPIGIILVVTAADGIRPMPLFNQILGIIVNLLRSVPFLLMIFMIMPINMLHHRHQLRGKRYDCTADFQRGAFYCPVN